MTKGIAIRSSATRIVITETIATPRSWADGRARLMGVSGRAGGGLFPRPRAATDTLAVSLFSPKSDGKGVCAAAAGGRRRVGRWAGSVTEPLSGGGRSRLALREGAALEPDDGGRPLGAERQDDGLPRPRERVGGQRDDERPRLVGAA